jgi:hypothetical protein
MIGALISREGSRCGTPTGCWHWGCESILPVYRFTISRIIRLSIPFSPPTKRYNSLEDVVRRVPNYAYQLYFANPESTKEIGANVWKTVFGRSMHMLIVRIQLEKFLRLMFAFEKSQNNNLENIREVIVNNGVTRPSTSVPVLTNDVCATPMRYNYNR